MTSRPSGTAATTSSCWPDASWTRPPPWWAGGSPAPCPRGGRQPPGAPWPGNLRELRHCIQRAAVLAGDRPSIEPGDLGLRPAARSRDGDTLAAQVEALERRAIRAALAAEGHNHTRAARRLGLSRQGLLNKLDRHGLREREP